MEKHQKYFIISVCLFFLIDLITGQIFELRAYLSQMPYNLIIYIAFPAILTYLIFIKKISDREILLTTSIVGIIINLIFEIKDSSLNITESLLDIPLVIILFNAITFIPLWYIRGDLKEKRVWIIIIIVAIILAILLNLP